MAQAQILYVGTATGLAIFSNPGRSQRWLPIGDELAGQAILALHCNPDQPLEVSASTPAGMLASEDGGQSWAPATTAAPDLPASAITLAGLPAASLRASASGIERSEDQGHSWQPAATPSADTVHVLLAAPYHPDTIFAGTASGEVWISTDRGRSWLQLGNAPAAVTALAVGRAI